MWERIARVYTGPIKANLKFLANLDEPLVYIPSKGGGDETDHVGNFTTQEVSVYDGRRDKASSSLDVEGFQLVSQTTAVDDFYDDLQVEQTYHDEVKALLTELTSAVRVEIFDDTRRTSSVSQQRLKNIREPAEIIHNDYTAASGVKRLRDYFADDPDEAERLLQRRFAIVNVWRSIAGTVYNHPLVLCDATTLRAEDLISMERRAEDRIGELQVALYDAGQRWYYFSEMGMDEALVFKTFDSEVGDGARVAVHTSFQVDGVGEEVAARESMETRCFLFF